MNLLATAFFLLIPALLLYFQEDSKLISFLSPAFWAYALGVLMGTFLPLDEKWCAQNMEIFVALAIPILLFSANVKQWLRLAPQTAKAYGLYLLAVLVSVGSSIWIWQGQLGDAALRGAMTMGVYTGGTANMAAIHVALEGPAPLFAELNFTDLLLCGIFLLVLLSVFPNLLARFLPAFQFPADATPPRQEASTQEKRSLLALGKGVGGSLLGGAVVLGLSFGLTQLILGKSNGSVIVVMLTLLGLGSSLIPRVRNWPLSFETGDFLFVAFCVAAGAQIDLLTLWENDWSSMGFMVGAMGGIIGLFLALAWLFRIDVDTTMICLTAGLYGPPFIGPVAQKLQNRDIVVSGMTLGVLGLAIGNFAGLLVYACLG
jgi:uncharacterized membrane protein